MAVHVLILAGLFNVGLIARYLFRLGILGAAGFMVHKMFHGIHTSFWFQCRNIHPYTHHQNGFNWNRNGAKHGSPIRPKPVLN